MSSPRLFARCISRPIVQALLCRALPQSSLISIQRWFMHKKMRPQLTSRLQLFNTVPTMFGCAHTPANSSHSLRP